MTTSPDASVEMVLFLGDTHGDGGALNAALHTADALGIKKVVSVGDLWWRPRHDSHEYFVDILRSSLARTGVELFFVDGNNDDVASLGGFGPLREPREVMEGLWYLPRGCTWKWGTRVFTALGGAPTFNKAGKAHGVELFDEEETTLADAEAAMSVGTADVLVSHDAPYSELLPGKVLEEHGSENRALIRQVAEALRVKAVVHGHYHRRYTASREGVLICGLGRERGGLPDLLQIDLRSLTVSPVEV